MSHVILVGATGLVGSACLQAMISSSAVSQVSILSRRPVKMAEGHTKVKTYIQSDFSKYDSEILKNLENATGCVWALGMTSNGAKEDEYNKVTHDYAVAAADTFATLDKDFKFVYVSGEGATTTPGFFTPMFGRIKGRTEQSLLELARTRSSLRPYSVRPALVDARRQPEILPFIPQRPFALEMSAKILGPVTDYAWKSGQSPTKELGEFMLKLAIGDGEPLKGTGVSGEGRTVSNVGFRRLMGL